MASLRAMAEEVGVPGPEDMGGVFFLAKVYLCARTVLRYLRVQVQKGDGRNAGPKKDFFDMQTELVRVRSELTNLETSGFRADITSKQIQIRKPATALADGAYQNNS